jgi:hypothetical protein
MLFVGHFATLLSPRLHSIENEWCMINERKILERSGFGLIEVQTRILPRLKAKTSGIQGVTSTPNPLHLPYYHS